MSERPGFSNLYNKGVSMLASRVKGRACAHGEFLGHSADMCDETGRDGRFSADSEGATVLSNVEAGVPGPVTSLLAEDWVVEDIVRVDEARGLIYFSSSIGSPLRSQLCVASLGFPSTETQVV